MQNKPLSTTRLEAELRKEKASHERTKRAFDGIVGERNEFERLYINLKNDYAELAQLKVRTIVDAMSAKHRSESYTQAPRKKR